MTSSDLLLLVGVTGLEPATSRPPAVRASQLRHTPITPSLHQFSPETKQIYLHKSYALT